MNIYVGNLPFRSTEEDLLGIFAKFGEVSSYKIITDRETGRSRGFGFVEMADEDAKKAINELNGSDFDGKQLTVNEAMERRQRFNSDDRYNRRSSY